MMKGIFELQKHPTDSTKDKLKWCFAMPGKPHPTDFSVEPGSDHKFVKLERAFEESKKLAATKK